MFLKMIAILCFVFVVYLLIVCRYKHSIFSLRVLLEIVKVLCAGGSRGNVLLRNSVTKIYNNTFTVNHNFDKLPAFPCIFVVNHPQTVMDAIGTILIPKPLVFISAPGIFTKFRDRLFSDMIYLTKDKSSYNSIKEQVRQKLLQGKFIVSYVTTGSFSPIKNIFLGRVRTGTFRIARELNVPVIPIVFDRLNCNKPRYCIHVSEPIFVTNPETDAEMVKSLFKKQFKYNKNN